MNGTFGALQAVSQRGVIILFLWHGFDNFKFPQYRCDYRSILMLSSSCNKCISIVARTIRLVFIYCRLVLSSTHFGKWDNLKLFDSIVKKILSFPLPFCENARCNTDIFNFFQSCPAITTKINQVYIEKTKDSAEQSKIIPFDKFFSLAAN